MPAIGITFSHYQQPKDEENRLRMAHYFAAVEDAGGEPVPQWIPHSGAHIETLADRAAGQLDGLLLSGGGDLDPALFGREPTKFAALKLVNPARPRWEQELIGRFTRRGKPVLGICYGCQLLNVWFGAGGTLIQDIPTEWYQPIEHGQGRHEIRLEPGSRLRGLLGDAPFDAVTSHHQAIGNPAAGARIVAHAPDGIPEAIEFDSASFVLGVQWHPERDRESEQCRRLFEGFIDAAKGGGSR